MLISLSTVSNLFQNGHFPILVYLVKVYLIPDFLTRVYLLDFFCSGIQFYLLMSPCLCFISFLYLALYVLVDDALIS